MRYYLIDEISRADIEKLRGYLTEKAVKSGLDDLFWVKFPDHLLTEIQLEHDSCQPYVFGLELSENTLKAEFFTRNRNHFGCSCQQYCDDRQRDYVMNFVLNMVDELKIRT